MDTDDAERVGEALQEGNGGLLDLNLDRGLAHAQQAAGEDKVPVLRQLRDARSAHAAEALAAHDAAHAHDAAARRAHVAGVRAV
ncbi:hypothetical protein FI667_g5365, partial [Globisporangium splendens]